MSRPGWLISEVDSSCNSVEEVRLFIYGQTARCYSWDSLTFRDVCRCDMPCSGGIDDP
jgi:hypothetical protein